MITLKQNKQSGFIMKIVILIIALILLKFVFKFDVIEFLKSPWVKEAYDYIKEIVLIIWNDYIVALYHYIYNLVSGFVK